MTTGFRILFATSEIAPWVKTGGLGDVAFGLCQALIRRGHEVRVVMPFYGSLVEHITASRPIAATSIGGTRIEVIETELSSIPVWLIRCPGLYSRPGTPYASPEGTDWPDNDERFGMFGRCLAWLASAADSTSFHPEVLHLNDWTTALAAPFVAGISANRPAILFTVHNLGYQGLFQRSSFDRLASILGMPQAWWSQDALEFHGRMSFIKSGLVFSDALSTVSPGYALEIQTDELGFGLGGLLRRRAGDLHAIINGIDTEFWDPARDPLISHRYDVNSLNIKVHNKTALQQELGLEVNADRPLAAVISRLVEQKGTDLVIDALDSILGLGTQLAVLGVGEPDYRIRLQSAQHRHPGRMVFANGMNEGLAHRLEAGADLFLMPSRYEPCGLNQMYSMRYGTVPVVRRTGGLANTVDATTGFVFDEPSAAGLSNAVASALKIFRDPGAWRRLQRAGMGRDFSWNRSAAAYEGLYEKISKRFPT